MHFLAAMNTYNTNSMAVFLLKEIFRYHRIPDPIFSDRDPKFILTFSTGLISLYVTKLFLSSTRHPQTDGASKTMNRRIGSFLRWYCSIIQNSCEDLLPAARFSFDSSRPESTGHTPFNFNLSWNPLYFLDKLLKQMSSDLQSFWSFRDTLQFFRLAAKISHEIAKAMQSS